MTQINPLYNAIILGNLLSAIDRIGVSLPIVARQTAKLIASNLEDIIKLALRDKKIPENLSEIIDIVKEKMGNNNLAEKIEIDVSGNNIETRIASCMYLDVANFCKLLGYNACPTCLVALMAAAFLNVLKIGTVSDVTLKNNGSECYIKLTVLEGV